MTPDDMRRRVERCADAVSVELYDGVTTGVASALAMLRGLPNSGDYPHLLSLNARAFMREHWLGHGLPAEWSVAGNPRLMGQTMLVNTHENIEMRLLKERRRTYPGGVPVAGASTARQGAWRQPALGLTLPAQPVSDDCIRLLVLWDAAQIHGEFGITLRVVHTLEPGWFGSKVPLDLSYEIKPTGGIFDMLRFRGDAQDEDLFAEIEREENEGDEIAE
ncbi:hypothetical protein [Knoellia subterranea]|uniref:Uncharacterized protein n=1 Tax=Knoellia subterranea KCTC 19937 TaxID=1385521 RepID=A0A0A0JNS6_9MICO|nr:hypothetical protein [Knoellia subterranea]KGN37276.1 hypothetical protein N803_14520 [Knoellia subterranea KCTC 19937]